MTPRSGTTDELQPGMYVRARDDTPIWRVEERVGTRLKMQNAYGEWSALDVLPARPVTILEPTQEEAVALVQSRLGAEVVGERDAPRTPFKIPNLGGSLGKWRHHLFLFHGQWANDVGSTLAECRKFHQLDHEEEKYRARGYVPHQH